MLRERYLPGPSEWATRGGKVRFDAPTDEAEAPRGPVDDVLPLFQAWYETDTGLSDRRRSPRYIPAKSRAWVGWWRRNHFVVGRAAVVNLSQGGALLILTRKPPTAQPVWLCPGAERPDGTAQARVLESRAVASSEPDDPADGTPQEFAVVGRDVGAEPAAGGTGPGVIYLTRLEFHAGCPASFVEAAGRLGGA